MQKKRLIWLGAFMLLYSIGGIMEASPRTKTMADLEIYGRLVKELKPYIDAGQWEKALRIAERWEGIPMDTASYADLLRVLTQEETDIRPIPFPQTINSAANDEYAPTMSADGRTLYFVRNGLHTGGSEDIYRSRWHPDGYWTEATCVTALSTPTKHEAPTALSVDGTMMLLFSDGRMMATQKTSRGWTSPVVLPSNLQISTWQADAMISSDGQALLFAAYASTDNTTRPSLNIYVSLRDSVGQWGRPFSIGPTINTEGRERAPFLHPDMHTLYFSSDGHGTLGGLDVFVSTRLRDNSWVEWSTPRNIGRAINTTDDDCWYKISTDGSQAYYAREVEHNQDIYWVSLPMAVRPHPVAIIRGIVQDEHGNAVYTSIRWEDIETHQPLGHAFTDPQDGSYYIALPVGKHYGYYVDDARYYPISASIDLVGVDTAMQVYREISLSSYESMIVHGTPVAINNLFFQTDQAAILPTSLPELQRLALIIQQHKFRVELLGHTDNTGTEAYNQQLSEQRAKAVGDYLVSKGCRREDIIIRGMGDTQPCASNETSEGRQLNRRVEIRFSAPSRD